MASQTTFVLGAGIQERQRTTKSGVKSRFTLSVEGDSIVTNLDETKLAAPVALAIKQAIMDGIRGIGQTASAGTILGRKYAANAFAKGATWAVKRYSGGRTGAKAPGQSDRLFSDSGRLADGVFVQLNRDEGGYTINVPANRLDPSTFKTMDSFLAMVQRLRSLVPALNSDLLADLPSIREAVATTVSKVLTKRAATGGELSTELLKAATELATQIIELGEDLGE